MEHESPTTPAAAAYYSWGRLTPAGRAAAVALGAPVWAAVPLLADRPPFFLIAILLSLLHVAAVTAWMARHYTTVQVADEALMYRSRGRTLVVHWPSLRSLRVRQRALEVDAEQGSVSIGLGFRRADDLVREVVRRLPDHTVVDRQAVAELERAFQGHEANRKLEALLWLAGLAACLLVACAIALVTGQPLARIWATVLVAFLGLMALARIA